VGRRTQWIISNKEVSGCPPNPSTPLFSFTKKKIKCSYTDTPTLCEKWSPTGSALDMNHVTSVHTGKRVKIGDHLRTMSMTWRSAIIHLVNAIETNTPTHQHCETHCVYTTVYART